MFRRWHIPLHTLVSVWDEVLQLMLSIFELENTHKGCGFLLLQKLLVRIADVFKATFSQNHLCQRESSEPVNIPL